MNEKQIKELFSDEAFLASILSLETPEEVQAALKEKGLDISLEEVNKIAQGITKMRDGTLSDDQLDDVSGGFAIALATGVSIYSVLFTAGGVLGAGVGLGSMVDHFTNRRW